MTAGDSLNQSFNQDDAEAQRSVNAKQDDQAEGLKNKKALDLEKIQHIKVGSTVSYTKGSGTIVKKDGSYVTIFNETSNSYDQVHAGETYIPGDTISMGIMNQLWDQMTMETRASLLHKSKVQDPLHFINRSWREIPSNLKEVIKLSPHYVSVGSGVVNPPKGAVQDGTKPNKERAKPRPGTAPKTLGSTNKPGAHTTTTGTKQTKFGPGSTVNVTVQGQQYQTTQRRADTWHKNTTEEMRNDPNFQTSYGDQLRGISTADKPAKKPKETKPVKDEGVTFATGLDKAEIEIYKLRNLLNKQLSRKDLDEQSWVAAEKSDVEHGLYGGVVSTDTPFDAPEDYEEDDRTGKRAQNQHNTQKKPDKPEPTVVYTGDKKLKGKDGALPAKRNIGQVGVGNKETDLDSESSNQFSTNAARARTAGYSDKELDDVIDNDKLDTIAPAKLRKDGALPDMNNPKYPKGEIVSVFPESDGSTEQTKEEQASKERARESGKYGFNYSPKDLRSGETTNIKFRKSNSLGGKEDPFSGKLIGKGEGSIGGGSMTTGDSAAVEANHGGAGRRGTRYGMRQVSAKEAKRIQDKLNEDY